MGNEKAANEMVNLIRNLINEHLQTIDQLVMCKVNSVNDDQTVNVTILTDEDTVLKNLSNNSGVEPKVGDIVYVMKVQNRFDNAFIINNKTQNISKDFFKKITRGEFEDTKSQIDKITKITSNISELYLKQKDLLNKTYPVGSIYLSDDMYFNPTKVFSGEWSIPNSGYYENNNPDYYLYFGKDNYNKNHFGDNKTRTLYYKGLKSISDIQSELTTAIPGSWWRVSTNAYIGQDGHLHSSASYGESIFIPQGEGVILLEGDTRYFRPKNYPHRIGESDEYFSVEGVTLTIDTQKLANGSSSIHRELCYVPIYLNNSTLQLSGDYKLVITSRRMIPYLEDNLIKYKADTAWSWNFAKSLGFCLNYGYTPDNKINGYDNDPNVYIKSTYSELPTSPTSGSIGIVLDTNKVYKYSGNAWNIDLLPAPQTPLCFIEKSEINSCIIHTSELKYNRLFLKDEESQPPIYLGIYCNTLDTNPEVWHNLNELNMRDKIGDYYPKIQFRFSLVRYPNTWIRTK